MDTNQHDCMEPQTNADERRSVQSVKSVAELHQHVLMLWGRYTDLIRDVLVLQGRLADLVQEAQAAGKQIYDLYGKTDEAMDGEKTDDG